MNLSKFLLFLEKISNEIASLLDVPNFGITLKQPPFLKKRGTNKSKNQKTKINLKGVPDRDLAKNKHNFHFLTDLENQSSFKIYFG